MRPGPPSPRPSTFVNILKGFCYCQYCQRQQSFNWQETVFTLSGFPIMCCAAFSRNTIASKNRNCLDLPSSQHNDSMASGTGLELGPNALNRRDSLSMEVKEATSRHFQARAGSCLLIPLSFCYCVCLCQWSLGRRKERKEERGPWTKRKGWRGGGRGGPGGGDDNYSVEEMTQKKRKSGEQVVEGGSTNGRRKRGTERLWLICSGLYSLVMVRTSQLAWGFLRVENERAALMSVPGRAWCISFFTIPQVAWLLRGRKFFTSVLILFCVSVARRWGRGSKKASPKLEGVWMSVSKTWDQRK